MCADKSERKNSQSEVVCKSLRIEQKCSFNIRKTISKTLICHKIKEKSVRKSKSYV